MLQQNLKTYHTNTLIEHLHELRSRLFICVLALVAFTAVGIWQNPKLIQALQKPLGLPLYYSAPAGGLVFMIKIALLIGFILALPVIIYQLIQFVKPALPQGSNANIWLFVLFSFALLALGIGFGYFVSLPVALHFLSGVTIEVIQPLISTNEYLNFVVTYLLAYALIFQLPLVLLFINRIKPLNPKSLLNMQKWVIFTSFLAAALITPTPDFINQTVMAAPMIVLYQVSILLVWLKNRGLRQLAREQTAAKESPMAYKQPKPITVSMHSAPAMNIAVHQPMLEAFRKMPKIDLAFTVKR